MRFVILGMLRTGALSLYDVRQAFARTISLFYSASAGSIQRALENLVADGHVDVAEVAGSRRGKRLYRITGDGIVAWQAWMHAPITGSDPEQAMLAKVFFLGALERPADRAAVVDGIRARLDTDLARLRDLAATAPARPDAAAASQWATLDYGIRSLELARTWLDDLDGAAR